jgi:hypothetical protein
MATLGATRLTVPGGFERVRDPSAGGPAAAKKPQLSTPGYTVPGIPEPQMPLPADARDLKKRLAAAGFEIFRVVGNRVHLADRVRDNLIMDSRVAAVASPLAVRLITLAPRSAFTRDPEEALFSHAREKAAGAVARGYREVETLIVPVSDPGGGGATIETWYEVAYEKAVADERELASELRFALGLEKVAGAG